MPDAPLILCYDGSEDAKHAIQSTGDLLVPRPALSVTVWEPMAALGPGLADTAAMVNFAELDRAAAESAGSIAEEGARLARDAGLEAEPVAVKAAGSVWQTIIEFADRHGAAAIVMGSRGLNGLRSILLGSVSRGVAHHAKRPTMVIHHPSQDSESARLKDVAGLRPSEGSS
jgi:nucleotide-binding universal stress UspA family protein